MPKDAIAMETCLNMEMATTGDVKASFFTASTPRMTIKDSCCFETHPNVNKNFGVMSSAIIVAAFRIRGDVARCI